MAMNKFIDITDFSREELRETLNQISYIRDNRSIYANDLAGKTVATAFYGDESLSQKAFCSAVAHMGGTAVSYGDLKDVSLKDAVLSMCAVNDAIVIDHPLKGASRAASLYASVPVINAGDGGRAYPVRTLADIAQVWVDKKHVSNMKIGFLGDFSNNACVKGILQCLNLYKGNEFYFISVNGKPLNDDYIALMDKREKPFVVFDNLFDILPELDVLYMTPVDKASFDSEIMYEARKHNFTLNERMLMTAKPDLLVMHPFPRGEELDMSVDADPRAGYFKGQEMFMVACKAVFSKTVSQKVGKNVTPSWEEPTHDCVCGKADCITSTEKYLPPLFKETSDGRLICKYCNGELEKDE